MCIIRNMGTSIPIRAVKAGGAPKALITKVTTGRAIIMWLKSLRTGVSMFTIYFALDPHLGGPPCWS